MPVKRFELPDGGLCELFDPWLAPQEALALLTRLHEEVPWERRTIRVFGRDVMQPRLVAWVGDPCARYTYSHTRYDPLPWTPTLAGLRERVQEAVHAPFNAVLCNLYRDGRDSMGMHADAEPELGPEPVIASLSLGVSRRFTLRHRRGAQRGALDLRLDQGSLLVMRAATQQHYRHGVPKEPRVQGARINLTFRWIRAG